MTPTGKKLASYLAIAVLGITVMTSCEKDKDTMPEPTSNIVELAQGSSDLSTLLTALSTANLADVMKSAGPFTVFAPSNAAFEKLDAGVLDLLIANPDALAEVLQYHVVSGKVLSTGLSNGSVQTLLSGKSIDVMISGGIVTLNGSSKVISADVQATNGVVHIIDEVLLPEGFVLPEPDPTKSIVEIASETASLSILVEALTMYPDLVSALSGAGSYTVFAPSNEAFTALLGVIGQTSLNDIPESVLARVLKYHVISGASFMSTDLTDGQMASTILGSDDKITVGLEGSAVKINGATVTMANVKATNGIVHIVDAVLVPSLELSIVNTIVEPAYFNKNFSILTEAVVTANLLGTLTDPTANFTLFAPDNAAFAAAGFTTLEGLTANDLAPILTYHVLNSEVFGNGLPATGSAVTSLGGDLYLSINSNGAFINGTSQLTLATIAGGALDYDNGVVHLISRTLKPAAGTIVDIAVAASQATEGAEFGQLVAALSAVESDASTSNLITILNGSGPYTVFAPTDEAFQGLYAMAGVNDFNGLVSAVGIGTIEAVLKYHVVAARVFSSDLPNVQSNIVATLGGNITLSLGALTITDTDAALNLGTADAGITSTDIMGSNGVIHVINKVLLP